MTIASALPGQALAPSTAPYCIMLESHQYPRCISALTLSVRRSLAPFNVFVCTPAGIACLGLAGADKENWVGAGATPLATSLAAAVQRAPFSGVAPAPRVGTQKGGAVHRRTQMSLSTLGLPDATPMYLRVWHLPRHSL